MTDAIRTARDLGQAVRTHRLAQGLTQDALAARCGVGRRFIAELEAGKPTSQLGKALLAASEVGLTLTALEAVDRPRLSDPLPDAAARLETDDDPLAALPRFTGRG